MPVAEAGPGLVHLTGHGNGVVVAHAPRIEQEDASSVHLEEIRTLPHRSGIHRAGGRKIADQHRMEVLPVPEIV